MDEDVMATLMMRELRGDEDLVGVPPAVLKRAALVGARAVLDACESIFDGAEEYVLCETGEVLPVSQTGTDAEGVVLPLALLEALEREHQEQEARHGRALEEPTQAEAKPPLIEQPGCDGSTWRWVVDCVDMGGVRVLYRCDASLPLAEQVQNAVKAWTVWFTHEHCDEEPPPESLELNVWLDRGNGERRDGDYIFNAEAEFTWERTEGTFGTNSETHGESWADPKQFEGLSHADVEAPGEDES